MYTLKNNKYKFFKHFYIEIIDLYCSIKKGLEKELGIIKVYSFYRLFFSKHVKQFVIIEKNDIIKLGYSGDEYCRRGVK